MRNRLNFYLSITLTSGQSKILVDDSGCPRIIGSGVPAPVNLDGNLVHSITNHIGWKRRMARWAAPEVVHWKNPRSKEADVFSFAMVMIEVRCKYHCSPIVRQPLHPDIGFHWRGSLSTPLSWRGGAGHILGEAAGTANPPKSHGQVVGIGK